MTMRSRRLGRQTPTKSIAPSCERNDLNRCLRFNALGGLVLEEWQQRVLTSWLGLNGSSWAADTIGLAVPRQNGKTLGITEARMNYGIGVLRQRVIYTAHLQKTSTETFEDMAAFFDQPAFRKYLKDIKTALGREEIILKDGGHVKFLARTRNGGNGQHGDLLVFDEAQELTDKQQSSFLPAISAGRNPQTIYTGTPPDDNTPPDEVFRRIREQALSGIPGMSWSEWSVDEVGDVSDRDRWYATNPGMGVRITEKWVENECRTMSPETFAVQRLGWWRPEKQDTTEHVIDAGAWESCRTANPPAKGLMCVGVKFASTAALSVCMRPEAGVPYIEVIDARPMGDGIGWIAEWVAKRKGKIASVAIDGASGAVALSEMLREAGMPRGAVVIPTAKDFAAAISLLVNAVPEHGVEHYGQPALDASATLTEKRNVGTSGGIGFRSTSDADAALVESCALAMWQALTTKRRPGRKARVYA